ncbi:MAG: hypothetical protein FWC23_03995 [Chitinispirillia bacterium]|nr:hypothetical protein [Chitinispirillia bacterium]
MYPNLEAEQVRCGYSDGYVAQRLGISAEAYRDRKESDGILLSEAVALAGIYKKSMDYLFCSNTLPLPANSL